MERGAAVYDIVVGLLLNSGGLDQANQSSKQRVIDSINPVNKNLGIWQARDNYIGAAWIIAVGHDKIYRLCSADSYGNVWKEYKPSSITDIFDTNNNNFLCHAVVASFHDTKHETAPASLLRISSNYVYRNVSGHVVPVAKSLVEEILEINKVK